MPPLLIIGIILLAGGFTLLGLFIQYIWPILLTFLTFGILGLGGLLAYFGWEERRDRRGAFLDFSSPAEASRYQAQALAYQEKINSINIEPLEKPAEQSGSETAPDQANTDTSLKKQIEE